MAETKLDESFPDSQFAVLGYKKPYRLDVTANSGGLLIYTNKFSPTSKSEGASYRIKLGNKKMVNHINL